jgi:L-seryl-tRNA(Ser) seleniumtransferase
MKRAMRLDKLRIALLEAIFRIYLQPAESLLEIPLIRWLKRPIAEIESIAQQAAQKYQDQWGHLFKTEVQYDYSEVGSGSLPEAKLETVVLALTPYQWNLQKIASRFRENKPPIIGRIHQNKFLLDMRTVDDVQSILPNFGDIE